MHDETDRLADQETTRGDEPAAGRQNTTTPERSYEASERGERQAADSAAGQRRSLADDMDEAIRARNGEERGEVH
jgi:hypothetical protein